LLPLLLALAVASGGEVLVVVTAPPPLDAARLAETLRSYLDDSSVAVQVAPAAAAADLRTDLATLQATGVNARAVAAVRVAQAGSRTLEIQLVDLVTEKTLVATVPAVAHEADLYRVLALKIQALLRSALYEAVATSSASPAVERIVAVPAVVAAPRRVLNWDAGYTLVSFPLDGIVLQGVLVRGSWSVRPWFSLGAGARALAPRQLHHDDVTISLMRVPVSLSADLQREGRRFGGTLGLVAEVAAERVSARSETASFRSQTALVPALGVGAEGRVRLASSAAFFLRCAGLALPAAERYTVRGTPVLDTSRWQLTMDAGLSVGAW